MTSQRLVHFLRERLLTLGAAISIALLIGAMASRVNATGYFGTIRLPGAEARRTLGFGVEFGAIVVAWGREEGASSPGIHYGFGERKNRASDWYLRVPFWVAMPLLCVLPVRFARVYYRQNRRRGPGRCSQCGYDLRATPERCPECGAGAVN